MFFTEHPVYDYATVKTADGTRFMEFHKKLLDLGVFLPPSQFETCFLSEAHTNSDIRRTVESFRSALSA
jgi:glutamate-1-semialdehyde 2,1-aminomutase